MWQLIEGLDYLHEYNVAHGDIHTGNVMMDACQLFPDGFHGAFNWDPYRERLDKRYRRRTRLEVPVKYYYIDFGSSVMFPSREARRRVTSSWAVWKVPEIGSNEDQMHDLFKADVYTLGLTLLDEIRQRKGLEFLLPALAPMISEDPNQRPDMSEVKTAVQSLLEGLSPRTLRGRVGWKKELRPDLRDSIAQWMEYAKLLWHSYKYGLPKDILSCKGSLS